MISESPLAFDRVAKGGGADRVGEEDLCCFVRVARVGRPSEEEVRLGAPSPAGSL